MKSLASKYHRLLVYLRTNLQEFLFSQKESSYHSDQVHVPLLFQAMYR